MKVKEESEKVGLKLSIQKTKIMASSPITSLETGKQWKQWLTLFSWAPKSLWTLTAARQHFKKERHYFADKGLSSQNYGFSSSCV